MRGKEFRQLTGMSVAAFSRSVGLNQQTALEHLWQGFCPWPKTDGRFKKAGINFFVVREDYVEIHLNKGRTTKLDFNDWLKCSEHRWHFHESGYASSSTGKSNKEIRIHRIITDYTIVDHINRDKLDNRQANLRSATVSENCYNIGIPKHNKSGYRGVSNAHYSGRIHLDKWKAQIKYQGKVLHLGIFKTKEGAAIAYNVKARELFGEFAWENKIISPDPISPGSTGLDDHPEKCKPMP